jgi:hypothetical protein
MKIIFWVSALLTALLPTTILFAQSPDTLWTRTFGGNIMDSGFSVQQTYDGGFIFGGWTNSFGAGYDDFFLLKTDSSGNLQWQQTYGDTNWNQCWVVRETMDPGYILGGYTGSYYTGEFDMYVVRTDIGGNLLWQQTYGGGAPDYCRDLQTTDPSDAGYILAGRTESYGSGASDMFLVKTDLMGNLDWQQTYGGVDYEDCISVQQTFDGGFILGGTTSSYGFGGSDMYLVKTDQTGNLMWEANYGGTETDYCYSVKQTTDGGYILGGWTSSFGASPYSDIYLVKVDSLGVLEWDQVFGGPQTEDGWDVI